MMPCPHPRAEEMSKRISDASSFQERIGILLAERQFAQKEFPVQLEKLEDLLLESNPFIILVTFTFVDLTYLPELGRPTSPSENIDQYHIEIVQAMILRHNESEFKMRQFDPFEFQELRDLLSYVGYLHAAKDFPNPSNISSREEFSQLLFRSTLAVQTKGIRNWGYLEQTLAALKQLYAPLEDVIEAEIGLRISLLVDAVRTELASIGHKLQQQFTKRKCFMQQKTLEGAVEAYLREFQDKGLSAEKITNWVQNEGWTFQDVRTFLLHRSISFLLTVFAFEENEFARAYPQAGDQVKRVLSSLALNLGDLRNQNKEHFFLANPIWTQPIMRVAPNVLFWPLPTLFHSFCFEIIESIVWKRPILKEKFLKRRAEFLEQYTAELFRRKFSDAKIFVGSQWRNEITNQSGENDLLIIFDSVGLIIEAKSGAINPVARRGGASITQEIEQLITEAAEQAFEFARLLRSSRRRHDFETKAGNVNHVDTTSVRQLHCLNITMEHFGTLATQLPELKTAGLARNSVPLIPTMAVADLEVILEVCQSPFEIIHYLTRRAAFELRRKFLGDELDLLVLYLETGFSKKNLPDYNHQIISWGLKRKLDKYFMNWPGDGRFERPCRNLSRWWKDIFIAQSNEDVHGRYEVGCLLLDMPDEEQEVFESQFRDLCEKVKHKKPAELENVEAIRNQVISDVSSAVIVAAPVTTAVYTKRKFVVENFAENAMKETGASQAVVILVDVELRHWPYSGMYLLDIKDFKR